MEPATKNPVGKPKKLRSLVWNDFERVKRGDAMVAICKHCKSKLNGASTSGTTHLKNHLLRCPVKNNLGGTSRISYGKRLTSLVWNDFERVKRGDAMVAICKHCKNKLNGASTNGATHLKNHLLRCPVRNSFASTSDRTQMNLLQIYPVNNDLLVREKTEDGSFKPDSPRPDQDLIPLNLEQSRVDLARMIILHDYPLGMVQHIGFKRFVVNLQPSFCFTADTVIADCMEIYGIEKQRVHEILDEVPGRISVTADTWTSGQDCVYLCLTAHYIDVAWSLQKKILNFVLIDPNTEQKLQLSEAIITCMNDWGIDSKLFSLTLDNYSTSDDVASRIKEQLPHNRWLPSNGHLFHVRCAEHILNVIAQELLGGMRDVIHKVRESVRYVKSSESLHQKFNDLSQGFQVTTSHKNLCLDSPTRWKSTYLMLEAAVGNRVAFSHLQECDNNYIKISDPDWERVTAITNYLKLFVEVINVFSGVKYQTANLYFPEVCDIHVQLIEWCKSSDCVICSVALKLKDKFDIYWNVCIRLLTITAILDPRFKMKLIEYYYPQIYGSSSAERISDISKCIKDLYEEYTNKSMAFSSLDQGYACDDQSSGLGAALSSVDNGSNDRLSGYTKFVHETAHTQFEKSELDKYLDEPVFPRNVDFNILNWWKVNSPKYPVLSMVARDVLGIPMSTAVTSYSAYNNGGRVLASHWSPLSSDVIQAMMCTHDWLQTELEV